jgi:hypothetical protein
MNLIREWVCLLSPPSRYRCANDPEAEKSGYPTGSLAERKLTYACRKHAFGTHQRLLQSSINKSDVALLVAVCALFKFATYL